MTSHALITDAENAIARGRQNAAVSRTDPEHEAAVELMACGLLVDRKVVEREVRAELAAEIDAAIGDSYLSPEADSIGRRMGLRQAHRIVLGEDPPVVATPSDLPENMQVIPAGSTVRRMTWMPNSGEAMRAVTVDLPDGGTVELWVSPQVAPVLAAQLANNSVSLPADMGDYRPFAEGELTGLQEAGLECARCGRYVEDTAVATRLVGYTPDLDSTVVACHPRCGSSPWDVEQLRWLLEMPPVEPEDEEPPAPRFTCDSCGFDAPVVYVDGDRVTCGKCRAAVSDGPVIAGSPGDLFDPTDPAGGDL